MKFKINKSKLLMGLLGTLVLVAVIQTYQLNILSDAIASGVASTGAVKSSALASLPTQVGGC